MRARFPHSRTWKNLAISAAGIDQSISNTTGVTNKKFDFRISPGISSNATEANIFIHGYSAGHNSKDKQIFLDSIPDSIRDHTNIFAFWPSSHFTRFNRLSRKTIRISKYIAGLVGVAVTATGDRMVHFTKIRSRADEMGGLLLEQLDEYLCRSHPEVKTINLIGHSLGGRLIVSSLKNLTSTTNRRFSINDVLLMAAAVEVKPAMARRMRSSLNGRLINAYSKADWTLLMPLDEACLGRNSVEHFENIEITKFGHSDYWPQLDKVLAHTKFKSRPQNKQPQKSTLAANAQHPRHPTAPDERPMALALNTPDEIYQLINDELARIVRSLNTESDDATLNEAQGNARVLLTEYQAKLQAQLADLKKNAEWNTFTIAFYGETGAGKSTIIETLRILLQEPSKLASQQKFRELQSEYGLSEESLQQLQHTVEQTDARLSDLRSQLDILIRQHERLHADTVNTITRLQALIAEHKQTASLWQKLLALFKKMPEETELIRTEKQLLEIVATHTAATTPLLAQQAEAGQSKLALERQFQESESRLAELHALADGEIIGDGRADFTRQTQRYNFELDGQPFALLDVPGIEGNEGLIHSEIEQAVQTAHAVFYVTNQAAPPQTGDDLRKGTLEKIKAHLGTQTEVWTIFNKKITNPKHALMDRPLISGDESASLAALDEKMREHLGKHYREVFSLTALSAFLASTDHFAPNSQNAHRRSKILADFSSEDLLEKSRLRGFLQLLGSHMLNGNKGKITCANFHKANEALGETTTTLGGVGSTFSELSEKLDLEGKSAQAQLRGSFSALKQRLETGGETLIDDFASSVRNKIYEKIENDINNDDFKVALKDEIHTQQEQLSKQLPETMEQEVKRFRKDAEHILARFSEHTKELTEIYKRIGDTKLNNKFEFKIKIDNGIKIAGLLGGLLGIVLAPFTGGASLWLLGASALSVVVSLGKALVGFFSSDYKKSQQRKSTDSNLHSVTEQLRSSLRDSLQSALPDMQAKIAQLELGLAEPAKQTTVLVQLLNQSATQLNALSRKIDNTGNLQ